ncbi:MAG: DUF2851 family protein [Bacteroidales bacterium]|nr:DUF2851 family protein [Bacteroidales bacterium]
MNESFLSYLWKYRHINQDVRTESGDCLTILHPGDKNTDSGPDFFNARIRIGTTTWAGNIEIHVKASDWYKHGHHNDPAYDHTILHVVYEADRPVFHQNREPIQTLVIRDKFPAAIYDRYQLLMQNHQWIPCQNQLNPSEDYGFGMWSPAIAVERLENKTSNIRQLLTNCHDDWEEAFYRHLARSFGFKINSLPFELLAKSLPVKIVRQYCGNVFQMEALLFGQAGMLDRNFSDSYPRGLSKEYTFLREKYSLSPVSVSIWKFLRLRPSNFPTIRISQLAGFLCKTQARFFALFEGGSLQGAEDTLKITASDYWNTHYVFDKEAIGKQKTMGDTCVKLLIINGMAPFLFFYGLEKGQPDLCEKVLNYLEQTGGESNHLVERWKKAGFPVDNAMQTQALLHLKQYYCDKKRCLDCRIGSRLLANNG